MLQALRVFVRSVVQFERYGSRYVLANILTVALCLPVITAPAAFAALSRFSHTAQTSLTVDFDDYWSGFRAHFGRGVIVGLANAVFLGMLWINFTGYGDQRGPGVLALRAAWGIALVMWMAVQFYLWPILEEMEHPTLYGAIRNAAVMLFLNPVFTLTLLILAAVIIALSAITFVPLMLIAFSVVACLSNAAVLDRLERFRSQRTSS
ncbi:MAG TPA: hypothetical protein VMT34_14235 [Aggregatilineales bacterium]|nr:hypothetical protein [Aggregatilineales bacterium]